MKLLNCILILTLALASYVGAQSAPPLTVIVVIDQLPMFLVNQCEDLFGDGGFKRLERDGVLFIECRYSHAVSETGPGHATISTGCNPKTHGIVANGWQNPDGSDVYCVACEGVHPVTDSGVIDTLTSTCPANIRTDTFSDLWRTSFGEDAKIWSMSFKDRAAVTMAGRNPNGALWFHYDTGKFQSSTFYTDVLPSWCIEYNSKAGFYFDKTWERAVKPEAYFRCDTDDAWYEDGTKAGLPNTLPKTMKGGDTEPGRGYVRALQTSPFGNDWLFGLTKECLIKEKLGKDKTPDLLWVSFSCNDMCGHTFGPHSHEILDMTVRTDKLLADLLSLLDKQVGKGNYWFALSTDHGVCPPCESSLIPSGVGGRFNLRKLKDELQDHLAQEYMNGVLPKGGVIASLEVPTVSFNLKAVNDNGLDLRTLAVASANWLSSQPGVSQSVVTITPEDIASISDSNLRSHLEQSYDPERFSQVYLHPQPSWQSDGICSNHGSIHDYDTHVPLYFMGRGFKGNRVSTPADPTDLVTTLAAAARATWATPRDGQDLTGSMTK